MKYSLLIISIPLWLLSFSCHRSPGDESTSSPGAVLNNSDETGKISISREQFESMNMKVGDPVPTMFSNRLSANGYVEASPTGRAKIGTFMSGRVKQINFSTGDFVKSGETLFTLESYELILLQQSFAEAFQRLKLLQADYERLQVLWDEKIAAQKDFLKAESEYKSLQAEVEGLKAQLRMIHIDPEVITKGIMIPYLSVKSPISGTVIRQKLVLGQHIEPLETAMEVVNVKELRLRLELFEKSIPDLEVGQQVEFSLPDRPDQLYRATLSHIGKSVSSETRTVECYARIAEKDKMAFVNNMFVESTIITCEREALAIPEEALIREPERDFVLILTDETADQMTFRKIPVRTGTTRQGHTEILEEDITSVLMEGAYNLWTDE
ncbi:MAG: efflux RND transporter periplasmic adaptor subunit [Bacteroidales bacterium]|nr:efflux RND transporter periplasmic adaptor subunit [Bacteroidales bacterium]